jgi:hypothetical protein
LPVVCSLEDRGLHNERLFARYFEDEHKRERTGEARSKYGRDEECVTEVGAPEGKRPLERPWRRLNTT